MSQALLRKHPGWMGALLSTSGLSLLVAQQADLWGHEELDRIAQVVAGLAAVVGVVLLPRYIERLKDRAALDAEICDPQRGPLLGLLPAGFIILGAALAGVLGLKWPGLLVGGIGLVAAVSFGVSWAAAMVRAEVSIAQVHGGWLIPSAMYVLVPIFTTSLGSHFSESTTLLTLVGWAFLGLGSFLFALVMGAFVLRLATSGSVPAPLAPTLVIPLAPMSIIGVSADRLLRAAMAAEPAAMSINAVLLAVTLGMASWWAFLALALLRRLAPLNWHPGWWGFVFPLVAWAVNATALAGLEDHWLLRAIALVATSLAVGMWGYVSVVSLRRARD